METPNYDFSYTANRELSWLKFNERVLKEAADESVPLFERLKFVSIFTANLDEFFMVRVGKLYRLCLAEPEAYDDKTGMTASQQLEAILHTVRPLCRKRDKIFAEIQQLMARKHVLRKVPKQLKSETKLFVKHYFEDRVLPVLSPQVIDLRHPFPHLVNKQVYVFLLLKDKANKKMFGVLPLPSALPKLIFTPGKDLGYILLEDILLEYAQEAFPSYQMIEKNMLCVTRSADILPDDEAGGAAEDYRFHVKKMLKKRGWMTPVRLEIQNTASQRMEQYLIGKLHLSKEQIFYSYAPMDMEYIFHLGDNLPPALEAEMRYPAFFPQNSLSFQKNQAVLPQIWQKDFLLSFPYEDFNPFLRLLKEAALDPDVVSVKITIYRLSNQSKLAEYLCLAAENGKDVTVLMELRARFDEQNNIGWAERMEKAGCHVIYGFDAYKVHSKICLVTRKGKNKMQYITQIGTGNYNENTAKLYTDLSLFTSNERIGRDAAEFFQNMGIGKLDGCYDALFVSPYSLKQGLIQQIDMEMEKAASGREGRIIMKMNALTDRDMIDKLAQASQAGVNIQLIVRGACCLIPGVKGKTENITVVSIIGRFLEHSRVYCFGEGSRMNLFLSSADLMTRNMERRVEIACPILDRDLKKQIYDMLQICLHDTVKAKKLNRFGLYTEPENPEKIALCAQQYFMKEAVQRGELAFLKEKRETLFHRAMLPLKSRNVSPK